jgi:hypothetical protein
MKRLLQACAILATLTIALSAPNRGWADGPDPWPPKSTISLPPVSH